QTSPCNGNHAAVFKPKNPTEFGVAPPNATGIKVLNSETGKSRFRTTCHTPLASRSTNVTCLCVASSMNNDGVAFVPLETAAAPTIRESLAEPLICSFTLKVHPF